MVTPQLVSSLVPPGAMQVLDVCMTRYKIHPMASGGGYGAKFTSRYTYDDDWYRTPHWQRHDGFEIHWGLRPIDVARGGFISLLAEWEMRGRAKSYTFQGFGMCLNFGAHTLQRGPFCRKEGTPKLRLEKLIDILENQATDLFVNYGDRGRCNSSSCTHADPELKDDEVLTEPGLTTSGAAPLEQRVW